jgi:uncharacterized membrane protein
MSWRGSTTIQDRIFSSLPYLLPLASSLAFAGYVIRELPALGNFLQPFLFPVQLVYGAAGPLFGQFTETIIFFALYFLVVRNEKVPHFIRFNTMQALIVEILLFLIGLILGLLNLFPYVIIIALSSTAFLGALVVVIFSIVQSLRGLYAEIPTLSEAAYAQVR